MAVGTENLKRRGTAYRQQKGIGLEGDDQKGKKTKELPQANWKGGGEKGPRGEVEIPKETPPKANLVKRRIGAFPKKGQNEKKRKP